MTKPCRFFTMPRTFNNLYERIYTFENLYSAYLKARRNKRYRPEVLEFSYNLEENLLCLRDKLKEGTYRTGKYKTFYVYDPKKRMIFSLPFRDRVVQHALCNVIEPIFDARFINDSYACRKDRGTHKAVERLTDFLRRTQAVGVKMFCLKGDVAKYFPSVNQEILLDVVRKKIKCRRTMQLIEDIVRSMNSIEPGGRGIPIGNLTSQLLANVYLNELDYFVKQGLRCRYYLRYMDDFVLLSAEKKQLHRWKAEIEEFLGQWLGLRLNKKSGVFPVSGGIDFLGYRVWKTHRLLRKSSVRRIRRRLKVFRRLYARGMVSLFEVRQSVVSWLGHMKQANCYNLRRRMFGRKGSRKGVGVMDKHAEEYKKLKEKYPEEIVLYQVGIFYRIMFEDARRVADKLGLKLMVKGEAGCPVELCGFPESGLDKYVGRLVRQGFSVVICRQARGEDSGTRWEISEVVRCSAGAGG